MAENGSSKLQINHDKRRQAMKEIELLEEAKKELRRIGHVMNEVSARKKQHKEKLADLIKALPNMLARMALKEGITRAEVDEAEETIRLLKDRIDEIPVILKGLESWDLSAQYQVRTITRQIEKLYQSTKDKLKDGDESPGLFGKLRMCAPYIGMAEDCEEFLSELEKAKVA